MWRRFSHFSSESVSPAFARSQSTDKRKKSTENVTTEEATEFGGKTVDDDEVNYRLSQNYKQRCESEASLLLKRTWYHGMMPRHEIEELLVNDGDFLVRKTEVSKQVRYVLSVMNQGRIRHILFNCKNTQWFLLKDFRKSSISEVVEAHLNEKIPVMPDKTLLLKGIPRPDYYLLHESIELKTKLGGGNFGDVFSGLLKNKDGTTTDVAVKKLKGAISKKQRVDFMREASIMRKFDHKNIIRMFGVAPQEEPILVVLELAQNGSLQTKLQKNPDIPIDSLMRYAIDSCRGMCYLASRKVIHRDLAARNCLLGKNDDVKIADFGLSVDAPVLKLKKLVSLPIRWLAPEILQRGEFSSKSDVWAFGVLVWEIFVRCKTDPFPGETNLQARNKILSGQQPMQAPDGSPALISKIMSLCFTQDSAERPDFQSLFNILAPTEAPPFVERT